MEAGVWRRAVAKARRPRRSGGMAQPSAAFGLAGRPVHRLRLERQARRQADRHVGDVPAIVAADSPRCASSTRRTAGLARQGRFRLDAEMVRDNALKISGLLVDKIGGPSVKPYQPPGYWAYLNFPPREWQNSSGDGPLSPFALHALATPISASRHAGVRCAGHEKNARPTGRGRIRRCNRWC